MLKQAITDNYSKVIIESDSLLRFKRSKEILYRHKIFVT